MGSEADMRLKVVDNIKRLQEYKITKGQAWNRIN